MTNLSKNEAAGKVITLVPGSVQNGDDVPATGGSVAKGSDVAAPAIFETAFTAAFTAEFIGAPGARKWPHKNARSDARFTELMTFAQMLLSGAQTGVVNAGAHPETLDAALLAHLKSFLGAFTLNGVAGWPHTAAAEDAVKKLKFDAEGVRMAEAAVLMSRLLEVSARNPSGGGGGEVVKWPIKPSEVDPPPSL